MNIVDITPTWASLSSIAKAKVVEHIPSDDGQQIVLEFIDSLIEHEQTLKKVSEMPRNNVSPETLEFDLLRYIDNDHKDDEESGHRVIYKLNKVNELCHFVKSEKKRLEAKLKFFK